MTLVFEITKQFLHASEKIIATFLEEKDATDFLTAKVDWDNKTRISAIYRLYRQGAILKEVDTGLELSHQIEKTDKPSAEKSLDFSLLDNDDDLN